MSGWEKYDNFEVWHKKSNPLNILIEIIGWVGSILVVIAYFLNMSGKLPTHAVAYKIMNIVGSIGLIVLTIYKQAWQSAAVNVIWAVIALFSLIKSNIFKLEKPLTDLEKK